MLKQLNLIKIFLIYIQEHWKLSLLKENNPNDNLKYIFVNNANILTDFIYYFYFFKCSKNNSETFIINNKK